MSEYNYIIVGKWEDSKFHEGDWGHYDSNIINVDDAEVSRRFSCIDRDASTAAWLCKSANAYNWQKLAITLGMHNVQIRPLRCDHE